MYGAPGITLRCDCGADGKVAYGEQWTCDACGRRYDTAQIPAGEWEAIGAVRRRYRLAGIAVVAFLAVLVLAVALTGNVYQILVGLPMVLLIWFVYVKPLLHRRYRRAVGDLTRRWHLRAEGEP